MRSKITSVLFVIYLIALFWIIVLKLNFFLPFEEGPRRINLIPYTAPMILNGKTDFGEMILNVLIFVPLGIYAGTLFQQWVIGKKIFLCFLVSLFCESVQLILKAGSFDVTDIINNTMGGIIGLMIYKVIEKVCNDSIKTHKSVNIIAATGTLLVISALLFLKINHLWIFRVRTLFR